MPDAAFTTYPTEAIQADASLSPTQATLLALPLTLVLIVVFGGLHSWVWGLDTLLAGVEQVSPWLLPVFVVGILVHEGLHALGWKVFAGVPWSAFRFGVYWRALTPYAHCRAPMRARAYRWGAWLPGLLMGLVPALLGLALGRGDWMVWGLIFLIAAAGDLLVLWIIRGVPGQAMVVDHPSRAGCLVLREEAREGLAGSGL